MNTEQNYVGRGRTANTPTQKAATAPQTPSLADDRPGCNSIDDRIYEAQTALLKVVDDFWDKAEIADPVSAMNDLLYHWLTTPRAGLTKNVDENQLFTVLSLINFLTLLYQSSSHIDYLKKGGQGNV